MLCYQLPKCAHCFNFIRQRLLSPCPKSSLRSRSLIVSIYFKLCLLVRFGFGRGCLVVFAEWRVLFLYLSLRLFYFLH